jgi:hypothetical protein
LLSTIFRNVRVLGLLIIFEFGKLPSMPWE